jgi:hypothetical protein
MKGHDMGNMEQSAGQAKITPVLSPYTWLHRMNTANP